MRSKYGFKGSSIKNKENKKSFIMHSRERKSRRSKLKSREERKVIALTLVLTESPCSKLQKERSKGSRVRVGERGEGNK
jgi:hypothetical protein